MTRFKLWVQDENPDKTFLLVLLMRACDEQSSQVPEGFRRYIQGDRSRELSYRVTRNATKGGSDVEFILE
jgi:hypothetical protein